MKSRNASSEMAGSSRTGLLVFVAPLAPALTTATVCLLDLVSPDGAPPTAAVHLALSVLWIAASLSIPGLRCFLTDLGDWLLHRVPFPVFFLLMTAALLKATAGPSGAFWPATASWWALMCAASALAAVEHNARRFAMLLIALAVFGVLLVGCDFLFRIFVLPAKSHNSIFIEHDPILGWKLRPRLSVERNTDSYRSRETINRFGFRTPEVPLEKPEGVRRIVILGDSHTEGYTVSDGETYGAKLEAYLKVDIPVQVISLGVGGFSTDQELLAYLHHGRYYDPDLVLLQFCANDVRYNVLDRYWRGLKPRFKRYGEMLLLEGVPVPNLRRLGLASHPLLKHSAIVQVVDAILSRYHVIRDVEMQDENEGWRVTNLLIRDLYRIVKEDGAEMMIFNAMPDLEPSDRRIRGIADRWSIPFVDILPAFNDDVDGHRVAEDKHWNRKGHDAVARFLAPQVARMLE